MGTIKYVSKRGKVIEFDDWCDETRDEDLGGYWVYMCPSCHNKYKGILRNISVDNSASGGACCSVKGCNNNNASYYVDFTKEQIIKEENKNE